MFSFFIKKKVVSHIKLNGVIGNVGKFKQGIDFAGQEKIIKKAFSLKKISAVAISINSPGGSPVQSHLIYKFIRQQAKTQKVKVIVFAEDVTASGGYLIACAGDEIYANSSSIVGSIGVIYSSFGFKDLIKKIGVDRRVYTAGKNKSTLDPFLEEKKEDIERLKNIQLDLHKDFIKVVEDSRGSKLNKSSGVELFSGEFWSGSKSKELGLVDGIGNANDILREKFDQKILNQTCLLSIKPIIYGCNVDEQSLKNGNKFIEMCIKKYGEENIVVVSAEIENQINDLNQEEKKIYMKDSGISTIGLDLLIQKGYKILKLQTYFTSGPEESRAWTIEKNCSAIKAAGVIHSDFEKGFIKAETVSYKDFINCNGLSQAKSLGKLRLEGKDYIVKDGDILLFRFNT